MDCGWMNSVFARIIEPAVGASVCASGSQVWNGQTGTLMAKAITNAQNATVLTVSTGRPISVPVVKEFHFWYNTGRS